MARIDRRIEAQGEIKLDLPGLIAELSAAGTSRASDRQEAMACFLSSAEGWQEARERLGGRFAGRRGDATLTEEKE